MADLSMLVSIGIHKVRRIFEGNYGQPALVSRERINFLASGAASTAGKKLSRR
jgi:hypothetical protein